MRSAWRCSSRVTSGSMGEPLSAATFTIDAARARPPGAIGLPRGEGVVRLHSPPFPLMRTKVSCGRPERSRASRLRDVHRRPLTARTDAYAGRRGKGGWLVCSRDPGSLSGTGVGYPLLFVEDDHHDRGGRLQRDEQEDRPVLNEHVDDLLSSDWMLSWIHFRCWLRFHFGRSTRLSEESRATGEG
jgi:hypothetical protein